ESSAIECLVPQLTLINRALVFIFTLVGIYLSMSVPSPTCPFSLFPHPYNSISINTYTINILFPIAINECFVPTAKHVTAPFTSTFTGTTFFLFVPIPHCPHSLLIFYIPFSFPYTYLPQE